MGNILCCFKRDIDQKDENGWTKLYKAAKKGNVDECRNLLSRGANINCTNKWGESPLMWAAHRLTSSDRILRKLQMIRI